MKLSTSEQSWGSRARRFLWLLPGVAASIRAAPAGGCSALGSRSSARRGQAHRGTALVQFSFFDRVSSWLGFPRACLAPAIQSCEAGTARGGGTGGQGVNQLHWHSCLNEETSAKLWQQFILGLCLTLWNHDVFGLAPIPCSCTS